MTDATELHDPTYREMIDDVMSWGRAGYPGVACGRYRDAAERIKRLESEIADHNEVHDDKRRLVRELDVLLNGEKGAAKQASLCDIVGQVAATRRTTSAALLPQLTEERARIANGVEILRGLHVRLTGLGSAHARISGAVVDISHGLAKLRGEP